MWSPTHVQVTVLRAKNLLTKGRNETNDVFVLMQLGKEKYQTSIKEKSVNPEWHEECDLTITEKETDVKLTVLHRNMLGLDEFLGQVLIPLQQFIPYGKPITRWYTLKGKGDKKEEKYRGEIEVRLTFIARNCDTHDTQSLNDFAFSKKQRRNSIKNVAISVGHKLQKMPRRSFSMHFDKLDPKAHLEKFREKRRLTSSNKNINAVEDDFFDEIPNDFNHLKLKRADLLYSSTLSLPQSAMITTSIQETGSLENINKLEEQNSFEETDSSNSSEKSVKKFPRLANTTGFLESKAPVQGEWASRLSLHVKDLACSENNLPEISAPDSSHSMNEKKGKLEVFRNTLRRHTLQLSEAPDLSALKNLSQKKKQLNIYKSNNNLKDYSSLIPEGIPQEVIQEYDKMSHSDLVALAIKQQVDIERQRDRIIDLETYLDNLLVRVMETYPRILQTPYKSPNPACFR